MNLPIALKAGLISKLSVKVSNYYCLYNNHLLQMNLFNIFSDSLKVTIEDLLIIVGPTISHMSQEDVIT